MTNKILLVGNCVLDIVITMQDFPQEDSEQRALSQTFQLGGNAANSAKILTRFGHEVDLAATLGDDQWAETILASLSAYDIGLSYLTTCHNQTSPVSYIILNQQNGSRTICHIRKLEELTLEQLNRIQCREYAWMHFEGRNISALQTWLSNQQISPPISIELEKDRPGIIELTQFAQLVFISKSFLLQKNLSKEDCIQLITQINPDIELVFTDGEKGAESVWRHARYQTSSESVDHVVDSIGAGDTFIGAYLHQKLTTGLNPDNILECLNFANQAAIKHIQRLGD